MKCHWNPRPFRVLQITAGRGTIAHVGRGTIADVPRDGVINRSPEFEWHALFECCRAVAIFEVASMSGVSFLTKFCMVFCRISIMTCNMCLLIMGAANDV